MWWRVLLVYSFDEHDRQDKFTSRSNEFIMSAIKRDKQGRYSNLKDPAAGVGLLLSKRAQEYVKVKGNENSEKWKTMLGKIHRNGEIFG